LPNNTTRTGCNQAKAKSHCSLDSTDQRQSHCEQ